MNESSPNNKHVNLLWTGGWDSTFQLLQLLIVHRCQVTPFYLIDEERRSTGAELLAMKRIKERLYKDFPYTQELLAPSRYFGVLDIPPHKDITRAFQTVRTRHFIGEQYDWLARFCEESAIPELQLCVEKSNIAHGAEAAIEDLVSESNDGSQVVFRVAPTFRNTEEYILFHYFSFPVLNISKVQMAAIANAQGWKEIMVMTWFCHTPRKGMKPCGTCTPCRSTIEDGLGWRIPFRSRVSAMFNRLLIRPSRKLARRILSKLRR